MRGPLFLKYVAFLQLGFFINKKYRWPEAQASPPHGFSLPYKLRRMLKWKHPAQAYKSTHESLFYVVESEN